APLSNRLHLGGNYTYIDREITDALQPDLEATGVPTHKAFLYAQWSPVERFSVSPSLEVADDRWSSVNPVVDEAFVATGAYALVNLENRYTFANGLEMSIGSRNLLDDDYELAWGFPQPGRTLYAKVRMTF